jgi:hypothetical protein
MKTVVSDAEANLFNQNLISARSIPNQENIA